MDSKRTGFSPRLGALIIDVVLVMAAAIVIGPLIGGLVGAAAMTQVAEATGESASEGAAAGGLIGAIGGLVLGAPIIGGLYFLTEIFLGASAGKLLTGLRIAGANGEPLALQKRLLRYAAKHPHFLLGTVGSLTGLSALTSLGGVLGLIAFCGCFAAISEKRQALHDLIAGTAVFPKAALQAAPGVAPA